MLKPTMPIYTATFPQDFWEHNFQQGGICPPRPLLKSPMLVISPLHCVVYFIHYVVQNLFFLAISHYMYKWCDIDNDIEIYV